jgi:tRNA threonylcarbamoyladenosine biosynthesis protein TsaB
MTDEFRCIAVETATEHCSVAAASGEHCVVIEMSSARDSSREIYTAINRALAGADLRLEDLTCIAFGCGPGSFTGLRIAAGAAQALAYARALPVCRISTLAALALSAARKTAATRIAACLDARMGEAYIGTYALAVGDVLTQVAPDRLLAPADIDLEDVADGWLAAGSGWAAWPEVLERNGNRISRVDTSAWPGAAAVADLARLEFAAGRTVAAHAAVPNYVREQVTA